MIVAPIRNDKPIIKSLMDNDFYKFTMGQLVLHRYPDIMVLFRLINRTKKVRLADHIDIGQLREELDHARSLRFGNSEIHYLRGTNEYSERMFKEDYLDFLTALQLPEYNLEVGSDGQLHLDFVGRWPVVMYWEILALAIVNELYFRSLTKNLTQLEKESIFATGILRLQEKINRLIEFPMITYCDFGTRRRFGREWQYYVISRLAQAFPRGQFLGTSNTWMAVLLNLLPMGTAAHELFMVLAAIAGNDEAVRLSHNKVLQDWWDEYGWGLSIALTDTFGSDFFFQDMTAEQAKNWKGLRQDSGDPFKFGEKAIAFYKRHGINPKDKLIVFSDGLDLPTILHLATFFEGRIKTTFGWGTNLTNDLGFPTLSLIVKAMKANGRPTVKLSDNLAKALGELDEVMRYKKIFRYTDAEYVECKS